MSLLDTVATVSDQFKQPWTPSIFTYVRGRLAGAEKQRWLHQQTAISMKKIREFNRGYDFALTANEVGRLIDAFDLVLVGRREAECMERDQFAYMGGSRFCREPMQIAGFLESQADDMEKRGERERAKQLRIAAAMRRAEEGRREAAGQKWHTIRERLHPGLETQAYCAADTGVPFRLINTYVRYGSGLEPEQIQRVEEWIEANPA